MMIPTPFLLTAIPLGWGDIWWAYQRGLVGWRTPVELAQHRVRSGQLHHIAEQRLSEIGKDQDWQVREILQQLSADEPKPEELSKRKWLYLTLLYLYHNRNRFEDPLTEVERIYADFDYPVEIQSFVAFLPSSDGYDPLAHSDEENRARLLNNWERYLDIEKQELTVISL